MTIYKPTKGIRKMYYASGALLMIALAACTSNASTHVPAPGAQLFESQRCVDAICKKIINPQLRLYREPHRSPDIKQNLDECIMHL